MRKRTIRLSEELADQIREQSKKRGFTTGPTGLFAFLDALTKTVLTCLPEPSGETQAQAVARAKARYERFLKSVGLGIAGDTPRQHSMS